MSQIRILLVDDHAVVRAGLRMLLAADPELQIVGEAENGAAGVRLARELAPDVVLMDISMPDMNGIEATRRIKEACPDVAVLALTMHEDDQYFFEMLAAGASGYVPKRAAPNDLISAIHAVQGGGMFLFPFAGAAPGERLPAASPSMVLGAGRRLRSAHRARA